MTITLKWENEREKGGVIKTRTKKKKKSATQYTLWIRKLSSFI
jgi:hypothetical protein